MDRASAVSGVMMVTDRRRLAERSLVAAIRSAAAAGLDFVQVREKDLEGDTLLALAREVVAAVDGTATRVLVNGRPDVALAAGAHGVHLPAAGLPVAAVRAAFAGLLVGASCHDAAQARAAAEAGASLVVFGPVFSTPGKESRARGEGALADVCRQVAVPVYAIGGLDARNAARAWATGAAGVAAIRPFLGRDAGAAVRAFKRAAGRP